MRGISWEVVEFSGGKGRYANSLSGPLKNLNKSENASCSKVPDVGNQKNRNQTKITPQQSKKFEI